MNAQNQQNQVYQIVAGNGLQTAPFGLPIGASYDPNQKPTFGQRLMQGLGYVGDFIGAVNQTPEGVPALFTGLGALGNRYNVQQYNQAQLKQQQEAMERARQAEMQQQLENLNIVNEMRQAQGLAPIGATEGTGGLRTAPEQVKESLAYVGGVLGNQAMQNETMGKGFNPQAGAVVDAAYIQNRLNQQQSNLQKIATLGKVPEALTAGAGTTSNVNTAGVPQSAVPTQGAGDPFKTALNFTRKWEGGYSNNPADKGGPTNLGITQSVYNSWRKQNKLPQRDVKNISSGEATAIYKKNYWEASGASEIAKTNPALAQAHFDTAVNLGVGRASQIRKQSGDDIEKYLNLRQEKYNQFAKSPSQRQFLEGWTNRTNALKQTVLQAGTSTPAPKGKSTVAKGNPPPQGQIMSSLNAYNNSPVLRQQAVANPYQVAIADPTTLLSAFGSGADAQNAVNTTNLNYRGQNIQQEQNRASNLLREQELVVSRENAQSARQQAQAQAEAVAMQKQKQAEADRIAKIEAQNTKLLEAMSKKSVGKEEKAKMQDVIDKNNAVLGTLQTGLPFTQSGQVDFTSLWTTPPPKQETPKSSSKRQAPTQPTATARVNRRYNPNTLKWE